MHFWLKATNSLVVSRTSRHGSCSSGIGEDDGGADGQIVEATRCAASAAARRLRLPVLAADPDLAERERGARQHQELHEVAALDVVILRPVDREVLPPGRLRVGGREVRRDGDLLALGAGA